MDIKPLITAEEIDTKLAELGKRISEDYAGKDLLLVGVLRGAFMVMADLARHIDLACEFDFMAVSSYGASTQTSGVVRILKDLDEEIDDRHVLIVEDIIDSGLGRHEGHRLDGVEPCQLVVGDGPDLDGHELPF